MASTGDRQPTIFDVASAAGVSKSVVSRVMRGVGGVSEEKTRLVREAARTLGYVPSAMARGLASNSSKIIGTVLRNTGMPFYGYLQSVIQRRARELGFQVVSIGGVEDSSASDVQEALRELIALRVEGLIICSAKLTVDDLNPFKDRIPMVVAGHEESSGTLTSVYCDEWTGGATMARYVYDFGHRTVAVFLVPERYSLSQHMRGVAMISQLRELHADVRVYELETMDQPGRYVEEALRSPRITAYMCPSDPYMLHVLEELRRRGVSVPDDVSVCGYDGIGDLASSWFGFTTYRQPMDEIGAQAVDRVVEAMRDPHTQPVSLAIQGTLVTGRTVRRPLAVYDAD